MDLNKSLQNYLDEVASDSPTPGGGNVAAFSGALACSLGIMVCNLSIGKKKYIEVEEELKDVKFQLENFKEKFLQLAEEDNAAFNKVMAAFKMPKETDAQKSERDAKIEEATMGAANVPAEVIKVCKNVIPSVQVVAQKGNQNSLSDAGVAVSLLKSAAQGAMLNVVINCSALKDQSAASDLQNKTDLIYNDIRAESVVILNEINYKLKKK
ncbi:MAG: cyclodeaminase/cyclohydrolase family protein [Ignavibacteriales bacterium]|nr:MAG: cyclodeaminase/cyclohydrolase family protein [Ignavibacteriales bacterium]